MLLREQYYEKNELQKKTKSHTEVIRGMEERLQRHEDSDDYDPEDEEYEQE